jgi:hypothetical protein
MKNTKIQLTTDSRKIVSAFCIVLLISLLCLSIAASVTTHRSVSALSTPSPVSVQSTSLPTDTLDGSGKVNFDLRQKLQTMNANDSIQVIVWVGDNVIRQTGSLSLQVALQFNGIAGYVAPDLGYFHLTLRAGDIYELAKLSAVTGIDPLTEGPITYDHAESFPPPYIQSLNQSVYATGVPSVWGAERARRALSLIWSFHRGIAQTR